MVDFFDKIYSSLVNKNPFLDKIRFYSTLRFAIRLTANIILPVYFIMTRYNSRYKLHTTERTGKRLIVSLTSFPARINRLWLVIESILRQDEKPDTIILWLSKEQFSTLEALPNSLLRLRERGLKIELRDGDLRSHKKYYYALQEYPDDIIITIDDDVFYHSCLLHYLRKCSTKFPNSVCCTNSKYIAFDKDSILLPYAQWKHDVNPEQPNFCIFPVGIGGVLYPPKVLDSKCINQDVFMECCPKADDVWLNVMTKLAGHMAVQTKYSSSFLPVMNRNNVKLTSTNLHGGNDIQINAVRKYCIEMLGKDPFDLNNIKRNLEVVR